MSSAGRRTELYRDPNPDQEQEKEKERIKEVDLEAIATRFMSPTTGVPVQDRSYLLTTYPQCFVGALCSTCAH